MASRRMCISALMLEDALSQVVRSIRIGKAARAVVSKGTFKCSFRIATISSAVLLSSDNSGQDNGTQNKRYSVPPAFRHKRQIWTSACIIFAVCLRALLQCARPITATVEPAPAAESKPGLPAAAAEPSLRPEPPLSLTSMGVSSYEMWVRTASGSKLRLDTWCKMCEMRELQKA